MLTWAALEKIDGDNNVSLRLLSAEHISDLTSLASEPRIWKNHSARLTSPCGRVGALVKIISQCFVCYR